MAKFVSLQGPNLGSGFGVRRTFDNKSGGKATVTNGVGVNDQGQSVKIHRRNGDGTIQGGKYAGDSYQRHAWTRTNLATGKTYHGSSLTIDTGNGSVTINKRHHS